MAVTISSPVANAVTTIADADRRRMYAMIGGAVSKKKYQAVPTDAIERPRMT